MRARRYNESDANLWDAFCRSATASTFLHTRRFLSYHGDRFIDHSLILESDAGDVQAILPAAQDPADIHTVVSHPGITYGGLLVEANTHGMTILDAFESIAFHYRQLGYRRLLYKAIPYIYHQTPCQDDLYALFRLGATRYRCDLSATIRIDQRGPIGSRRKRALTKARKAGLTIGSGRDCAAALWTVLTENLKTKHNATPVHTLTEIELLSELFDDKIDFICAIQESEVIAGIVVFDSAVTSHAQYIASSTEGYESNALDLVFEYAIERARQNGKQYFDFGISNEQAGMVLNHGLYTFKCEFGAGGVVHEFYELTL